MNKPQSLQDLVEIALQRHQTSGRQLAFKAQDEGYTLAGTTLNHIRAGRYKSVPSDDTIRAIAWLAGVSEEVAFTAAGQTVPGPPLADELPPGADNLSAKSRKVLLDMVRVLVDLETGNHDTQDKPEANPPGKRTLRAIGPSDDAGQGQKIPDRDDPVFLIPPPIEQLAANPYAKTHREKFEEAHGERGEENQDPNEEQP